MHSHLITSDSTLFDALRRLNDLSGKVMTLIVTDADGRVTGTLTDGDIRRSLLRGVSLTDSVTDAMFRRFSFLRADDTDVRALRALRRRGLRLIPVLDADGRLVRLINTDETSTLLPVSAILMAGGKGERLRPLTLSSPKPLLRVGEKAIIDYNIEALRRAGVENIYVTVNYLADQLIAHFADTGVSCIREPRFLGTIGAARLAPLPAEGHTIVMNSDLLTSVSFEDLYLRHVDQDNDITIATTPYNLSVPYAVLATDGSRVTAIEEKPSLSFQANAGIYIFRNSLLLSLPADTRTDAPDLIEQVISAGGRVGFMPIAGTWIDIGSHDDFRHACRLMEHVSSLR